MEHKNLPASDLSLKLMGEGRKFSGYASVFNGVDSYGDTIVPGAYEKTLVGRERPIRMRWNHMGPIIGKWTKIEEDEKGLYVEGELTEGHRTADDAYALIKHGAVEGMSIGYRLMDSEMRDDIHYLKEIDLVEISLVEEPADLGAQLTEVKSAINNADSFKEIERLLRDAGGFSRTNASALVARIKSLTLSDSEPKQPTEIVGLFDQYRDDFVKSLDGYFKQEDNQHG